MNGISLKTKLNSILTSIINCLPEGSVTKVVGVNGNGCLKVTDVSSLGGGGVGIPQNLSISGNNLSISQGNTISLPVTDLAYTSNPNTGTVTSSTGVDAVIPAATTSIAGLLTSADKIKLNSITGINTDLSIGNRTSTTLDVFSNTGTDATIPFATTSLAGLFVAADKTKLDGIATSANLYIHPNHSGDVVSVADGSTTIQSSVVTNVKLANMGASTIKGAISSGSPIDLTASQVKSILNFTAADVSNIPSGNIAATTVQAALNELDGEKQTNIQFQEEGSNLGASGNVNTINFTGANVTASRVGNVVTVDVTGGSGGGVTNLSYSSASSSGKINSDTGEDATIPAATGSIAGLLTASDKTKLDGIATGANLYIHPNHSGDVTSVADGATTISTNAVTFAKFQQIPTATLLGRSAVTTGNVETITLGTGLTLSSGILSATGGSVTSVGISGSDFTISSSPIITSGTISLAIANNAISNAKLAQAPANTIKGNNTGVLANETDLTVAQVKTLLSYTASDIVNVSAGNIASGNVQGALNELDNEKQVKLQFQDEGVNTGTLGGINTINFTGATVTANSSSGVLTVDVTGGGASGNTNLSYAASPINGIVASDTGADATLLLADGTNAGLQSPAQFTKLGFITVTSATNLDTLRTDTTTNNAKVSNASHTGDATGSTILTLATVNSNVGTFGSATQVAVPTVNAKGLITAVSNVTITPAASSITGGAALSKTDDTNVTLTLGGTPTSALLSATSLTLGWTGVLAATRGGTGLSALGTSLQQLRVNAAGTALEYFTAAGGGITSLNALTTATQTFTNDTNVTIVSGGSAHVITWSGTLADTRITSAANWNKTYQQNKIRVVSVSTTLSATTDGTVVFDTGATTATLPVSVTEIKLTVKNVSAGTITVSGHIDGFSGASYVLAAKESMQFHGNGTTWYYIA
jgi:hypothetical protein